MALQRLVDRDAASLVRGLERLEVVIGFDGAADVVHVMLRLVDYLPEMAKVNCSSTNPCTHPLICSHSLPATTCPSQESELKGIGLAVAMGDDHNANLALVFKRLGAAINHAIVHTVTVCIYLAMT